MLPGAPAPPAVPPAVPCVTAATEDEEGEEEKADLVLPAPVEAVPAAVLPAGSPAGPVDDAGELRMEEE